MCRVGFLRWWFPLLWNPRAQGGVSCYRRYILAPRFLLSPRVGRPRFFRMPLVSLAVPPMRLCHFLSPTATWSWTDDCDSICLGCGGWRCFLCPTSVLVVDTTFAYDLRGVLYCIAMCRAFVTSLLCPSVWVLGLAVYSSNFIFPLPYFGTLTYSLSPSTMILSSCLSNLRSSDIPLNLTNPYLLPPLFLWLGMKISLTSPHFLNLAQRSFSVVCSGKLVK